MEKFTLINKAESRIKVFEPYQDSSKNLLLLMQFESLLVVFLSDQVNLLRKAPAFNCRKSKKQI